MNDVHRAVLRHVRESLAAQPGPLASKLAGLGDEQLVRMMFSSYRGRADARGMRLTNFGLQVMRSVFKSYEIALPEGHRLRVPEILYLDHRASLPYFVSDERVVLFESELGLKLKLADGDLATLIEIESSEKLILDDENS